MQKLVISSIRDVVAHSILLSGYFLFPDSLPKQGASEAKFPLAEYQSLFLQQAPFCPLGNRATWQQQLHEMGEGGGGSGWYSAVFRVLSSLVCLVGEEGC